MRLKQNVPAARYRTEARQKSRIVGMTNAAAMCTRFGRGTLQLTETKYRATYNQVSISGAVHFICKVDGATSVLGDRYLAFLCGLQVPNCVVVLWMLLQLLNCQRCHGEDAGLPT
jgi:hypothetical protein